MWDYIIDDESGIVKYKGNLEDDLRGYGVSSEAIEKAKKEKIEFKNELPYYESNGTSREIRLVPVDRVKALWRGTPGKSVFENVESMRRGEREPFRFKSALMYLTEFGLDRLKESYQNLEYATPRYVYYQDDDIYYVNDGTHRTLIAKLIGAPYIKAEVTVCHCNYVKKAKYDAEMSLRKKHHIIQIKRSPYGRMFYGDYSLYIDENGKTMVARCYDDCIDANDFYGSIKKLDMKLTKIENQRNKMIKLASCVKNIYKFVTKDDEFDSYYENMEDDNVMFTKGIPVFLYNECK